MLLVLSCWLYFWRINHSQFYLIKKTNQKLLWINIIWLMFVALVPFSANLVGHYGYLQVPMIFFNLNLALPAHFNCISFAFINLIIAH
jgi:uncharacterized membrane protein